MRRLATKGLLISLLGLVCALVAGGCTCFQVPRIDPSGERFLIWDEDISNPNAPNSRFKNLPGKKKSSHASAVILCPQATVAPVGSEVVMLAAVRGKDNYLRTNQRVEWMISPKGTGQFVQVDKGSWTDPLVCDFTDAKKIDNSYAINSTSRRLLRLTRGTEQLNDDVHVLRGQAWVTVTSAVEGTSSVTAYAPNVHGWETRKDSATIHWVDAQWSFPAPAISSAGDTRVLTTTVGRHTDQSPRAGWLVRYEIVGGPEAGFSPAGAQVAEVQTDGSGAASVEIFQKQPAAGTNQIAIQVICPVGMCGTELREPVTVGKGCTQMTWSSANVALRMTGPASGSVGSTLTYRIEVSNSGDVAAEEVVVTGAEPAGMSYVRGNPPAEQTGGTIRWPVGRLGGGDRRTLEAEFRVDREGTVEVCAEASAAGGFKATDCVVTAVESPKLQVKMTGPQQAEVGDEVQFEIAISNPGRVAVTDLRILDDFDEGLEHAAMPAKNRIDRILGRIEAGGTSSFGVAFRVVQAGRLCNRLEVTGPGGIRETAEACVQAVMPAEPDRPVQPPPPPITNDPPPAQPPTAPGPARRAHPDELIATIEAPASSTVGGKPKFAILVKNVGEFELTDVVVTCFAGRGLRVDQATEGHEERPSDRAILFRIPSMMPGPETRAVIKEIVCICEPGFDRAFLEVVVTCREGINQNLQKSVEIGSATAPPASPLTLTVDGLSNPVDLNRNMTCEIRVTNNRTVADRVVALEVAVPPEMIIDRLRTRGPAACTIDGNDIRFDPVDSLSPGDTLTYRIRLRTAASGTVDLRAVVWSTNVSKAIEEIESITINRF